MTFPITLGGRRWEIPDLPFGVIKHLQPRLLARASDVWQAAEQGQLVSRLTEEALDELADLVTLAIGQVQPQFTRAELDAMHFPTSELIATQVPLMQACGLIRGETGEGQADPKAVTSTISSPG